jgi:hypothetical protein
MLHLLWKKAMKTTNCKFLITRCCFQIFSAFLLLSASSSVAISQSDRGGIEGRVLDPSGAVVPGAQITLRNMETNVVIKTASNASGIYSISNLPVGLYNLDCSKEGFITQSIRDFAIETAKTVHVDVALVLGKKTKVVFVRILKGPYFENLQLDIPLISNTVLDKEIKDLPLSFSGGRQIESFAYALTPSVEGNSWTSHIAGSPAFTKEVLIDGLPATSQIQGNVMESSPPMEAIAEFRVQTSASSAEYGHASGGVFNYALKSGGMDLHGSAYYNARNETLNANSWMNNFLQSQNPGDPRYQRSRDRQSIFGVSGGGPVVIPGIYNGKNRSFLFGSFDQYRQQDLRLGSMDRTVPIADFLEGDFSRLLTTTEIAKDALGRPVYAGQIYDPSKMRQINGAWVSDPFVGNIIPTGRISSVSNKIIDIFKDSYRPITSGLTNNSAGPLAITPWFHQTQLAIRGDHHLNSSMRMYGSLIWTERPRILADQSGIWDPLAAGGTGGPLARSRNQNVTSRAIRISNTWRLTSNLVNVTSFAYNRYRNPSLSSQADGAWNKYLGLQRSTGSGLFPEISFGTAVNGVYTTGIGYGSSDYSVANNYIISDTLLWQTVRHDLKFGGEVWDQQLNSHASQDVLSFNFSPTQTGIPGQPWSNRVGLGFASFLLGETTSASKGVPFDLYGRRKYVALFIQDQFLINRNITATFGLRWEQSRPLREKYGRWANFNPALTNTNLDVKGALEYPAGSDASFEKQKDWKEFGPNVGVAYNFRNRFVLRAGYSLQYIPPGMNYWSGVPYGFAPGYRGTNDQTTSGVLPKFNWDNGYPDNYKAPSTDPNALSYGMVSVDERSLFAGYTHQYNVSLQYEFNKEIVVEAAFLGNDGRRLHNGAFRRNQPSRAAYENPKVNPYAWIWDESSAAEAGVAYPYAGFSNYAGVALQPFPQVSAETGGPLYFVGSPKGSSGYKAFQLSVRKRAYDGFGIQLSYTLSRAVGNSETGFDETWDQYGGIQDINNLAESASTVLSYDQTHVVKGYISYQLPFGNKGKLLTKVSPAINALLSGWKVTGIVRYNSGNPLSVYPNAWRPGWEGAVYADFNPGINLSRQFNGANFNPGNQTAAGNQYFNTAAFSNPEGQKLGNGKRLYSELRGFGYAGEDLGLIKDFRFHDRAGVQLRAEFLNVFNRHYFANPNTNMADAAFGRVTTTTGSPRTVQLGLRLEW